MWKEQHYDSILLYGHVHNSIEESYFQKCLREMNNDVFFGDKVGDSILRAYNVGCMMLYMDYEPRTLAEIIDGFSPWDICDYRFWGEPIWREESCLNLRDYSEIWQKCYRMK